jgi:hypothetical protein
MSPEEIFEWVAAELQIENNYEMPVVLFVDTETLAEKFIANDQETIRSWKARYGSAAAEEIIQCYCSGILGIFDCRTQTVFIGNFIEECRAQAVLAHELIHYF